MVKVVRHSGLALVRMVVVGVKGPPPSPVLQQVWAGLQVCASGCWEGRRPSVRGLWVSGSEVYLQKLSLESGGECDGGPVRTANGPVGDLKVHPELVSRLKEGVSE